MGHDDENITAVAAGQIVGATIPLNEIISSTARTERDAEPISLMDLL